MIRILLTGDGSSKPSLHKNCAQKRRDDSIIVSFWWEEGGIGFVPLKLYASLPVGAIGSQVGAVQSKVQ